MEEVHEGSVDRAVVLAGWVVAAAATVEAAGTIPVALAVP